MKCEKRCYWEETLSSSKIEAVKCTQRSSVVAFYLRRGIEAALWRRADGRVRVLHAIFDTGSSQHFYVGDWKDALTVGAWDFAFIPVFIHSANERDPLSLQAGDGFSNGAWIRKIIKKKTANIPVLTFLKDISTTVSPLKLKRATASPYSSTCTGTLFFGWAFSVTGRSWTRPERRKNVKNKTKQQIKTVKSGSGSMPIPQHSFEGKCQLFHDVPLHTSFDPPVEWCKQCLLSETAAPYKWQE